MNENPNMASIHASYLARSHGVWVGVGGCGWVWVGVGWCALVCVGLSWSWTVVVVVVMIMDVLGAWIVERRHGVEHGKAEALALRHQILEQLPLGALRLVVGE